VYSIVSTVSETANLALLVHTTDIPPPLFSSRIRGVEILELLADNYRQLVVRTLLHESGRHVAGSAKNFPNVYSSRHDQAVG